MLARRPPLLVTVVLALCCAALAQRPDPLPIDTGATGLKQVLRQLQTTARLMHTTAHPDDEDGGMLTLEARGRGVEALLLTLTRGEGGQNKTGSNLFDELGVLRTLELLESDRYYGVQQRFTRLADFGYSKNAEEAFRQWQGHDAGLADMVRVIRTFRPDVLVSRFQGSSRDGHGHHEAAGILSREAFRAAADPSRFAEQIREGLLPWQAKKLYVDNVRAGEDYTVKLETTVNDPLLGASYAAFAMQGLKHQLSQGAGSWNLPSGPRYATYKLVDSVLPPATDKDGHEPDFFAGLDTTLPGLAARVHADSVPDLKQKLQAIEAEIQKASSAADKQPSGVLEPLMSGLELTRRLISEVNASALAAAEKIELLAALNTKRGQFEHAASLALGLSVVTSVKTRLLPRTSGAQLVAAGDTVAIPMSVVNSGAESVTIDGVALEVRKDLKWTNTRPLDPEVVDPGGTHNLLMLVSVPPDAAPSAPHFRRTNPETETTYSLTGTFDPTLPFAQAPIVGRADYTWKGHHASFRSVPTVSESTRRVPLAIAPPVSLLVEPGSLLRSVDRRDPTDVTVAVTSYKEEPAEAVVRLAVPDGWQVTPATQTVRFAGHGDHRSAKFAVTPGALAERHYTIRAVAESGGKTYDQGFSIVGREDLGTFYYYQRAAENISAVNAQVPGRLKIGYVMGAGDDIPTALTQLGLSVHLITADELAKGDLAQFDTIVLGIRAYETRDDLKQNNKRLLDYVHNGGTLLVQYTAAVQDFNSGGFTPYPAQIGRERVSAEQAPVQILAPSDPVFQYPNPITSRDFEGWIQERGLYFMREWDKAYEPLLASSDPGEAPLQGGLLRARYGKGTYLYTGYSFFRQLPAGVPGAVRLFVNLLTAGHDQSGAHPSNQSPRP